jgi:glutamyl-tRNA reductase
MFVAFGINYKTAPVENREKIARLFSESEVLLARLLALPEVSEALLLSTCNRSEIYCETTSPEVLERFFAQEHSSVFYTYVEDAGIKHALDVASGKDSMMVGEVQILGQMRQAYQQACRLGTAQTKLRSVFEFIFSAAKRIRTRSGIGANPVSVASIAVQLVTKFFAYPDRLSVFLIGSGETSSLVAKYLQQQGVNQFMIASRTLENAEQLAARLNATALTVNDIPHYLSSADVVISATACPLPFIHQEMVQQALKAREGAPMFFLDLAVPRDIEPQVGELEQVLHYNIDELQQMMADGLFERRQSALQAEALIELELSSYIRSHRAKQARHVICDYREAMQRLAASELQRAKKKLKNTQDMDDVLTELCQRLVKKLVHQPTLGLKQIASDDESELLALVPYLFNTHTACKIHEELA